MWVLYALSGLLYVLYSIQSMNRNLLVEKIFASSDLSSLMTLLHGVNNEMLTSLSTISTGCHETPAGGNTTSLSSTVQLLLPLCSISVAAVALACLHSKV